MADAPATDPTQSPVLPRAASSPATEGRGQGAASDDDPGATAVLAAAFRAAPSFLHVLRGPEFVFEFANEAYYRLVGRRDLLGRPAFDVLPEAAAGGFPARLAEVLATGRPFAGRELPVTLARTPGAPPEERLIDLEYLPLADADGRVTRVLGYGTDVTDHVRARRAGEAALDAQRAELARANVQLRGQQRELELANQQLQEQVAERARLVAELAAERERLRAVILSMPSPLALHAGPEHRFELINPAFQRISGGGRDDTGLTVREAFPELLGQGVIEALDRVYATGEPWVASELPIRYDRDGTGLQDTWYNVRYEPVRDPSGAVWGVLNFAFDVTEQVRARRDTERLLAESQTARADAEAARRAAETAQRAAEAANQAKGEFLAVMSHELRTPLNAIGGYAQLLDMGLHGPVTGDQRGALARVQAAQTRLLALINDVLNYAKLESGRVEYAVRPVDVADVVRDVVPLVEPQVRAKGLAFDVRLPAAPCVVAADREKLGQVLVNLLSNAVKFTDAPDPATGAPGRVTVDVATRAGATAAGDALAFLRVTDTGRGIPREKQDAIFEPFVQVRAGSGSAYAHAVEGTGLGLAISRDLARGMGGDLRVRSAPGEGATFTVALRRVTPQAADAAPAGEPPGLT